MSMTQEPTKALELFYSYAHTDERWRKRLEIHLSNLQRQGFIEAWHDRNISAGTTWASEIDAHLNTADIILLLISPDFIASEYCYSIEMKRAMERHQAREARVIPVILRPTDWEGTPFKQLQALPTNAKAVTRWHNRDDALLDVVNGIREAVKELLASTSVPLTFRNSSQETVFSSPASSTTGEEQLDITAIRLKPKPIWKVPTTFTPLVGRDQDVSTVCALLTRPEVRLLTLLGAGGIGKTRLAIRIAAEVRDAFPDGVYFVPLAPISDPTLVVSTIAQELDIHETGAQPIFEHLKTSLQDKHILLLLDNFEQIVTARSQVEELLAACQSVKIQVTSRVVLHIQGEQEFQVPPLALPDLTHLPEDETLSHYAAITLFLQRARAVLSAFELTQDNMRAIAEICVRLDGLPLAIELAAARIRILSPQALLTRLSQRLQVLTDGVRTAPARQQTLRNTITWSYNLLEDQEQRLFRYLSVFVGGCTLEAAESVCSTLSNGDRALPVLDGVSSLVEQSLLQQMERVGGEPRLTMLETVREYGLECLRESGEAEAIQRAHALYFLAHAEEAEPQLKREQQGEWLRRLDWEQGNIRGALGWLIEHEEADLSLRLAGALWQFWFIRGYYSEGLRWLEAALGLPQAHQRTASRAKALCGAGWLSSFLGDAVSARFLLEESAALFRELEDKGGLALAQSELAEGVYHRYDVAAARTLLEENVLLAREAGDQWLLAMSLYDLGRFIHDQGEAEKAYLLLDESKALFQELGDKQGQSRLLNTLARMAWSKGDVTHAAVLAQESLTLARELDNKLDIAEALYRVATTKLHQGDAMQAKIRLQECIAQARETGDSAYINFLIARALLTLGSIARYQANVAQAATLLEESLTLFRELPFKDNTAAASGVLGEVRRSQGDLPQALTLAKEGLLLAREAGSHYEIGLNIIVLARIAADEGRLQQSARLFGAAESWLNPSVEMDPFDRADYERVVERVREQLGEKAFVAAWAEGRAMTPEQVLVAKNYTAGS